MKLSACARLRLEPLTGYWFRALNLRHWKTRLATDHSRASPSRFSAATKTTPLFPMLYLGENHQVAIYEVGALLGNPDAPVANPKGSWALMSIRVILEYVADLSDVTQQKLIATNSQEMTGSWVNHSGAAPTQKLGQALHDLPDLEGFIYPSSKTGSRNLALFMDKIGPRSRLEFHNEIEGVTEKLA